MCSTPKINDSAMTEPEVIKTATKANAEVQKTSANNRLNSRGFISENIKTSNTGLNDDISSSKKKLLGE